MAVLAASGLLLLLLLVGGLIYSWLSSRIPSRRNISQAPRSSFGLVEVKRFGSQASPGNGVDLIFVHGLGSNPDTTWRAEKIRKKSDSAKKRKFVCWVTDFLPEDIPPSERDKIRIFFYNHDSFWQRDAAKTRLRSLGNDLLHNLKSIRTTADERKRSLVFVAHSYGGLIVKQVCYTTSFPVPFALALFVRQQQALIQAHDDSEIRKQTKSILFLGTPHSGSGFSHGGRLWARLLSPLGSNPLILDELATDSLYLHDLHEDFIKVTVSDMRFVNFYEQRKICIGRLWWLRWEKFCVPEQSAIFADKRASNIGLPVDHYCLNKFGARDGNYMAVLKALRGAIARTYPTTKNRRYSVPLRTVNSFTERSSLSEKIEAGLSETLSSGPRPRAVTIFGSGGTGKTQLALKYVEEHRSRYNPILWIDANTPETTLSSFERCASELSLHIGQTAQQTSNLKDCGTVQSVLRWLRDRNTSDEEWLVVFDNVDSFWGIRDILPDGQRGNIIITSQDEKASELLEYCSKVPVDTMDPCEARNLLLWHAARRQQRLEANAPKLCDQIAAKLGYLALAVDLAGAYIANDSDSQSCLTNYLRDYSKHQDELLQTNYNQGLTGYNKTVWTVWDTTVQKIQDENKDVQPILFLIFLAHFEESFIAKELFRLASQGMDATRRFLFHGAPKFRDWFAKILTFDEQWDDFYYRQACGPLIRYGLLKRVEHGRWTGVGMHGLLKWRALQYKHDYIQLWNLYYWWFLLAACHQLSEETRQYYETYLIMQLPKPSDCVLDMLLPGDRANAWIILSCAYYNLSRWEEAESLCRRAVEYDVETVGKDHRRTIANTQRLASILSNSGKADEAKSLCCDAISINKRLYGPENQFTLISMRDLALIFFNENKYAEAEKLHRATFEISMRTLGGSHPRTLDDMNCLGMVLERQGKFEEAEKMHKQVLATTERLLGPDHEDTLASLNSFGWLLYRQGRGREAEIKLRQAWEGRKRNLGPQHLTTLISADNLALALNQQEKYAEAEILLSSVLKAREEILGPDDRLTLNSMHWLVWAYVGLGRYNEAETLTRRALDGRERVLGTDHPDTLETVNCLRWLLTKLGRVEEARILYERGKHVL